MAVTMTTKMIARTMRDDFLDAILSLSLWFVFTCLLDNDKEGEDNEG